MALLMSYFFERARSVSVRLHTERGLVQPLGIPHCGLFLLSRLVVLPLCEACALLCASFTRVFTFVRFGALDFQCTADQAVYAGKRCDASENHGLSGEHFQYS